MGTFKKRWGLNVGNYQAVTVVALAIWCFTAGCQRKIYEDPQPGLSSTEATTYTLDLVLEEGFSGSFELTRQQDGTALGRLQVSGTKPGRTYYGLITSGAANAFAGVSIPIADLKKLDAAGASTTWLYEDYRNQPMRFDSLLTINARVVVLEVTPGVTRPTEVLRGDIGSNVLLAETRSFDLLPVEAAGLAGRVTFRSRRNGNLLVTTQTQGLDATTTAPIRLWRGDWADEQARSVADLRAVTATQSTTTTELEGFRGGLAALDTFSGFIGLSRSNQELTTFLAVAPLGTKRLSGMPLTVRLLDPNDSGRVAATVSWQPTLNGTVRANVSLNVDTNRYGLRPFYLTLHRGSVLGGNFRKDSTLVGLLPVAINAGGAYRTGSFRWSRGIAVSLNDLTNGDYHLRLLADTSAELDASIAAGAADIGSNQLTDNVKSVTLQPFMASAATYRGKATIRERRNGKAVLFVRLNRTMAGGEHAINLREGAFLPGTVPQPTSLVTRLLVVQGGDGSATSQVAEPALPFGAFATGRSLEVEEDGGGPLMGGNLP